MYWASSAENSLSIRAEMGVKRMKALKAGEVWGMAPQRDSVIVTIPERRDIDHDGRRVLRRGA